MREPCVAGQFYPSGASEAACVLAGFEKKIDLKKIAGVKTRAVVVPHAGWIYSGQTAAYSFAALKNSAPEGSCFVIFSPNHSGYGTPVALSKQNWLTPLGEAKNDAAFGEAIARESKFIEESEEAHESEHSIEVQLPFLQRAFKKFVFVPVTFMNQGIEVAEDAGKAVARAEKKLGKKVFVIASSDFTHYEPAERAREKDFRVIEAIEELDVGLFYERLRETRASVCGYGAIAAAMVFARETSARKGVLLDFSNSGDVSSDYRAVVDYAAIAFV